MSSAATDHEANYLPKTARKLGRKASMSSFGAQRLSEI